MKVGLTTNNFKNITENQHQLLENSESILNGELIDFISYETNQLMPIPLRKFELNFLDKRNKHYKFSV